MTDHRYDCSMTGRVHMCRQYSELAVKYHGLLQREASQVVATQQVARLQVSGSLVASFENLFHT